MSTINRLEIFLSKTDSINVATLWLNKASWQNAEPLTVDGTDAGGSRPQELMLTLGMLPGGWQNKSFYQTNPLKWSFDKWFKIGIEGDLHPGTANSRITVYQDGVAVINWVGDLGNQGISGNVTFDGLEGMHFGLYTGGGQGTFAVYNDAITVEVLTTWSPVTARW